MDTPDSHYRFPLIARLLHRIAAISAAFALVLCAGVILNYFQLKRMDPLNSAVLKTLTERLHQHPGDDQLREEIRELDLLSRKAFFTSQWQIRTGGYLLFFSLLVVAASLQGAEMMRLPQPGIPSGPQQNPWTRMVARRRWLLYTGLSVVVFSFLLVILSHRELDERIGKAMPENEKGPLKQEKPSAQTPSGDHALPAGESGDSTGSGASDSADVALPEGWPDRSEILANFPAFRGPEGTGVAFQKNLPVSWDGKSGKNIRWKTEIPLPGYSSPILWDGKVYLSGADEKKREVYCLDLATGKLLWRKAVEGIPGGGVPKVIRETGYAAPTMTTDGRRVYAIFANGDLVAFDTRGEQKWMKNLGTPKNHYGHSSSLIMYRDLLLIQYDQQGSGSVMAFRATTGEQVWKTTRNVKVSWASPSLVNTGNRQELILAADPSVASYDPATGKELWRIDCIEGEVGPGLAYAGGIVFSVNDYSKVAAIRIGTVPEIIWENTDYLSDIPSPVADSRNLYLVTSYGAMVCYDATSGEKKWEHEFGTGVFASPMLAEGKLYVLDKKGVMHILKAGDAFSVIAEPVLGEPSSCTPAFAGGLIVIRGDKHLYCIGK